VLTNSAAAAARRVNGTIGPTTTTATARRLTTTTTTRRQRRRNTERRGKGRHLFSIRLPVFSSRRLLRITTLISNALLTQKIPVPVRSIALHLAYFLLILFIFLCISLLILLLNLVPSGGYETSPRTVCPATLSVTISTTTTTKSCGARR
jgi:hypothetical protein